MFRAHLPICVFEPEDISDIKHDFRWRCPPNMLEEGAWSLYEVTVSQESLERAHEVLGEEASRCVLASDERIETVLGVLYIYPNLE